MSVAYLEVMDCRKIQFSLRAKIIMGESNVQAFLDKDLPDTRTFITMLGKVTNRLSQDQISSAILLLRV